MKKFFSILFLLTFTLLISCEYFQDKGKTEKPEEPQKVIPKNDYKETSLRIARITPSGEDVPAGRQIVIQFNRPVVPIGKMERSSEEIPIQISPPLNCQWRWLNTSALSCNLDDKNIMAKATRYLLKINPGITTEDGVTIGGTHYHKFITERPMARYTRVHNWKSPGIPIVRMTFNQSVSKSSVAQHVYIEFRGENRRNRYSVNVEKDPDDRQNPRYIPAPGEKYVLDFGEQEKVKSDDEPQDIDGRESRRIWLVYPKVTLPLDTNIDLRIEPGLESAFGPEKGAEERVVVNFDTFPEFYFVGIKCSANNGDRILVTKENSDDVDKCNPMTGAAISFSSPVLNSQIKEHIIIYPDLAGGRTDYDPWANTRNYSRLRSPHRKDRTYDVWLPEKLKAADTYKVDSKPPKLGFFDKALSFITKIRASDLEDEFGRKLYEPIDLKFFTDHRPPNFELTHRISVIEKGIDSEVPLYVTNLDKVNLNYRSLTKEGQNKDEVITLDIPDVEDKQFAVPLKVRSMLGKHSGAVFGRVRTEPPVSKYEQYHLFFAQVSPYQIHVKAGHFNTLIWVTDFQTGEPVENAKVRIYKDSIKNLSSTFNTLDEHLTNTDGVAVLEGLEKLDPKLESFSWQCKEYECERLFVRVDKDNDIALIPLTDRFEISTYRVSNYEVGSLRKEVYGHIKTWGTTAQGVYRTGDKMQYKLYVRNQDNKRFVAPPKGNYTLKIVDPRGKTVHEIKELKLSDFGSYDGEYSIPKNATVGWYQFSLSSDFTKYTWQPIRVLVSDFVPSPFKVKNSLNGDLFHPGDNVEVLTEAVLHSGGAYTDAETRVTVKLKNKIFTPKNTVASRFKFDSYKKTVSKNIFQKVDRVGDKGELTVNFKLAEEDIVFGTLNVESAVRDDRGRYIASQSIADYIAVDRLVGLKNTKWLYDEDEPAQVEYLVVDEKGTPSAGTRIEINIEHLETKTAKVKGAGNAYVTEYIDKWISTGSCNGVSDKEPIVCEFIPEDPGIYRFSSDIKDTKGKTHSTELRIWVAGKGRIVWRQPDDNSLQIIPEKKSYNIGDAARYLIKNPYPGSQALVSIERFGVLEHWTQKLDSSTPVIEFNIDKDYMPGFYLSVVVQSPRVESPPPKFGEIDLGKPSFKIGYVRVSVRDPYKQIDISIKTDKEIYKPREIVKATIHAEPKHKDQSEPIEIAVAVLDEAVLDLVRGGKSYFDPYEGFYKLDSLDLINYSLLTRLVGRQKFEKKGANPGGDGGTDISMRSVFKFVSYWNPLIKPDASGNAQIEFELPDNLTGWRILAFAVTPSDRMGLGDINIKVNLPTELRPVMPNQVTEGDRFQAGFSVMNRTENKRNIEVTINAEGNIISNPLSVQTVELDPYKRTSVFMPVETSSVKLDPNIKEGEIRFKVLAKDSIDGDGLIHVIPVKKERSLVTAANYGTTIEEKVEENILFPQDIYPDTGSISVVLAPSVIGNVTGAFRYIRDYDYICWEQILTKGVMASHYQNLKQYMPNDFKWDGSEKLAKEALLQAANYQAPNGGMVYFIPQNIYVSPYLSAYTALAFNWLRDSGYDIPHDVETKLHGYLTELLKKNIAPTFYSRGMTSTVRAVALAALSKHGKVSKDDLLRYREHFKYMSLFGKTHYLLAVLEVGNSQEIAGEVSDIIISHSNQSGGKFSFNEELDDTYSRILSTPLRANCSILTGLIKYQESQVGSEKVGDIPLKLVRFISQTRGNRDHWENTQENMFCMNSLIDYSRVYENITPNLNISVSLDEEPIGKTTFDDFRNETVILERFITENDPGQKRTVSIDRSGEGRLYYSTRLSYAPLEENVSLINAGIDIRKEYSVERDSRWVMLDDQSSIKRGELVKVDIFLSIPTARNFVVVDDPVPGGLEPVNRDLATSSIVDADKGEFKASGGSWWFQFDDWYYYNVSRWSFYHQEIKHDAVRFYSDYLPAGNYHLSYTAQAIAEGEFTKMPVHAEEMYDPDIFGKGLKGSLTVGSLN